MHGDGYRRVCASCGQSVSHMRHVLGNCELRGPRQITSSNIDRIFDDGGRRFLMIEEKGPDEKVSPGQGRLLRALAGLPTVDVWGVRGTPDDLTVSVIRPESTTVLYSGDLAGLQSQVDRWFALDAAVEWEQLLFGLAGAPFDPPPWCPPDVWASFDAALSAVIAARAQEAAA